jgi:RNA polymerase sigma-70 factor (ECF subfamily)
MPDERQWCDGPTSLAPEVSDHCLVRWTRAGDQDAATQFYGRYAKRLAALVNHRCSTALARHAGVEDIVQSVFGTFFRRVGQGSYEIADGDTAWKVLLVIAINRVRSEARFYHAARRDSRKTVIGATARECLALTAAGSDYGSSYLDVVLRDALEGLCARNRLVVGLVIVGLKADEIAQLTGCSTRNIERVTRDARARLGEINQRVVREKNLVDIGCHRSPRRAKNPRTEPLIYPALPDRLILPPRK